MNFQHWMHMDVSCVVINEHIGMGLFFQYYEGIRAAWLAKKSGQSYRHPFNVGVYKNITLVSLSLSWIIKSIFMSLNIDLVMCQCSNSSSFCSGIRSKHAQVAMSLISRPFKKWN